MKKLILTIVVALLIPLIYSCDKLDSLREFDINTQTEYVLYFTIFEEDPQTINEDFFITINDQDILDNLDNIEEWKVNKVTYQVVTYDGMPDIILNGTFSLGSANVSISNANLYNLFINGTESTLDLTDDELVALANDLKSIFTLYGNINGSVSDKPVYFNLQLKFDVTARAKA